MLGLWLSLAPASSCEVDERGKEEGDACAISALGASSMTAGPNRRLFPYMKN